MEEDEAMAGKPKRHVFLWGQYQSILHGCYQQPQLIFLQNWKPDYSPFFYYGRGFMTGYFPEEGIQVLRNAGRAALNPSEGKRRLDFSKGRRTAFWNMISLIGRPGLASVSDSELALLFEKYSWALTNLFIAFTYSTPFSTFYLEEEMRRILRSKLGEKESLDAFIALSTPPELDETQLERMDWLALHARKDRGDVQLMLHARKYAGLFANAYDEGEVLRFLRKKLANEAPDRSEERKIRGALKRIMRKQAEIYLKFKGSKLKGYSQLLQNLAIERFKVKLCWGGAEFLALPLFREIARRSGIRMLDLFHAYTPRDVSALIENRISLSETEIRNRKEFFCIFFDGKSTKFRTLSGQKAKRKMLHVLQGSFGTKVTELKGQIANLGRATGKARIILAHGLKQFERDLISFKKGEILITTMTSPGMVLIAKKAAAIVADEGGICSHAAVISRELGIPCIVGTKDAARIFKTGQRIEVDATKGIVKRV